MYDDTNTLLSEITAGEDSLLELKEVVFKGDQVRFAREEGRAQVAIAEVLVSMANTEGGVIVFGVAKNGDVLGVDEGKKEILEQFIVNLAVHNCVPPIEPFFDWILLPAPSGDARRCLKVTVPKAQFYVHATSEGRHLRRIGSHRHLIPGEHLGRLLAARGLAIPFEERPAFRARFEDLDRSRFSSYYQRRFKHPFEEEGIPLQRLLVSQKLARDGESGRVLPTNLGALLLCERPDAVLPGAFIDVAAYDHPVADGSTSDSRSISGPVPEQLEQILYYFRTSPLIAVVSEKTAQGREDLPTYSAVALQEAVVNAVVHRDYELEGSQVRVFLFPDRVEIWNPGALHNTLTVDDLYRGCQPIRRNQLLAGFMRDYISPLTGRSYMEARGEGFLNLLRESERLSARRPDLAVRGQAICLTIFAAGGTGA